MRKPIDQQKHDTITTRLTRSESDALRALSEKYKVKRSEIIRQMIKQTVKNNNILSIEK
jgi:type IV pilus biogenesis protein CpaD/CtpE